MATPTPTPSQNLKFDNETFNKNFDLTHSRANKINNKIEEENLNKLNNTIDEKKIIDLSVSEIIINMFGCWISIFNDINNGNFKNILTKQHRLFYIGLTIFIIGILLFLFDYFLEPENKNNVNKESKSINETRNIYINKHYNNKIISTKEPVKEVVKSPVKEVIKSPVKEVIKSPIK
jgi:hypothetical protein